ncbi:MAG TPA: hypothetical protein VFZ61_19060, partial [Polyangiales bacterium]
MLALAGGASAQQQQAAQEQPLPTATPVIEVSGGEKSLYRIAVPDLLGTGGRGGEAAGVLRSDFALISLFKVLDPASFVANLQAEALSITPSSWQSVGAQGVIKGELKIAGTGLEANMHFFEVPKGATATLSRSYKGTPADLRKYMHAFANEVVKLLTGQAGAFGTR